MNRKSLVRIIVLLISILILFFTVRWIYNWVQLYNGYRSQSKSASQTRYERKYLPDQYRAEVFKISGSGCERRFGISTSDNRQMEYLLNNCKIKRRAGQKLMIGDSIIKKSGDTIVTIKFTNGVQSNIELPFYY